MKLTQFNEMLRLECCQNCKHWQPTRKSKIRWTWGMCDVRNHETKWTAMQGSCKSFSFGGQLVSLQSYNRWRYLRSLYRESVNPVNRAPDHFGVLK
jgi:hypothetical protein